MQEFIAKHQDKIAGTLSGFDRLVFRGHLRSISYPRGMMTYLWFNQVLLKNFGNHVAEVTERLKEASLAEAKAYGRPVKYLNSGQTDKETIARDILAQDGVRVGLVCVLSCLEPWRMRRSVRFYRDILGMELLYRGEDACFSSLRAKDCSAPILNLEQGRSVPGWGRIFYVADVDVFWEHLRGKGLQPESPQDASWGERYFHMPDPDGHELSFARPYSEQRYGGRHFAALENSMVELESVRMKFPADTNIIVGQTHFIKTAEDMYEAVVNTVPQAKFGLAFNEASGPCLTRAEGNDDELRSAAIANAQALGAGHVFVLILRNAYPINLLNVVQNIPEVCSIFCATANPVEVIVARTEQGRGVMGVIDGSSPKGVEGPAEINARKEFLRKIGYKR